MINAKVSTNDGVAKATFDATEWFQQATIEKILNVVQANYDDDSSLHEIALHMESNPDLKKFFGYIASANNFKSVYWSCSVDKQQALAWIAENKLANFILAFKDNILQSGPNEQYDSDDKVGIIQIAEQIAN